MDNIDKQLLNALQSSFPLALRPYRVIGEQLGVSEEEALRRVRALAGSGIIRKIGPSFDTRKLGHTSTLVAAKVPEERLEEVASVVSSFPEVTHNYGRDFEYNLWFTLVSESPAQIKATLEKIKFLTGVPDMHSLPAERVFKIRVEFEF